MNKINYYPPSRFNKLIEFRLTASLLLVIFMISIIPLRCSGQTNQGTWLFAGEFGNGLTANISESTIETETEFAAAFEMEDNLFFEFGLANELGSDGESVLEAEFDLEALTKFDGEELEFYFETDLVEEEYGKAVLGLDGTLGETDFDFGIDLAKEEQIGYLDLSRRFDSGVSVRSGIELAGGQIFKSGQFSFRGLALPLNTTVWELAGKLETSTEKNPYGSNEFLKASLSLENEKIDLFRFPKQGSGISFYRLIPLDSEGFRVVLHNSGEKTRILQGWSVGGGGNFYTLPNGEQIPPGGKLSISVPGNIIENTERLEILKPGGEIVDSWTLPRFYYGNGELYRREGILERELELSFTDNEFDELEATWTLEIPSGPESFYYGDLDITHTGKIEGMTLGHESSRSDLEILLMKKELDIIYFPATNFEDIESEIGMKLNYDREFEAVFEIAQDLEVLEWENILEISTEPGESEIELAHIVKWKELEVEVGYIFENSKFVEFNLLTELAF